MSPATANPSDNGRDGWFVRQCAGALGLLETRQKAEKPTAVIPLSLAPRFSRRGSRALCVWILLLSIALLIAMAAPMLAGHVYTADDLGAFHLPMRSFYAHCLAGGNAFDWSPQMFCGFYLTGEGQLGGYHPLHLLLYRFLPLGVAFDLECLIGYPLILLGTYWFLRRWRLPRDAAMFGGMAFTFCGFMLLHFVHVNAIEVVAHLPWLLVAIDVLMRNQSGSITNRKTLAGAAVALLTASQLLLGYPQYVWFSLLIECSYALLMWRTFRSPTEERSPLGTHASTLRPSSLAPRPWPLVFWTSLGFVIAAVQLLPSWEALGESSRHAVDSSFRNWGSLHPLNLVQFVAPYLFSNRVVGQNTHEYGCYASSVTLLLAVWCVVGQKHSGRLRPLVLGAATMAVVGLVFAFGGFGPLENLTAWLPVVNRFRFPCRVIVLVHFALAVLAAIGLARLGRATEPNRAGLRAVWLLVGLSVVLAIGAPIWWPGTVGKTPIVAAAPLVWAGPLLIGGAALLLPWAARGIRWARFALVLFAAVDLGVYGMSYAVFSRTMALSEFVATTNAPPSAPAKRIAVDLAEPNQPFVHLGDRLLLGGWSFADGYAGLEPARRLDYREPAALRAAGVGWAVDAPELARRLGYGTTTPAWLRVNDSLPRAMLFSNAKASTDPARDIGQIDLRSTALVDLPMQLDPASAGTVAILDDRPGNIRLHVDALTQRLLFVSESFHPGWTCSINGKPMPVLRVDGDFLGCLCPPGTSEVRFEFRPESLRYGRLLSACGLSLLIGLVLLSGFRRAIFHDV
jgi:hypothetical protein